MQRKDDIRLQHMLEAAEKAVEFVKDSERGHLNKDEKLMLALVRLIEIVGEAAKNISEETKQKYQQIPWKEIAGTRNRLIHGYFNVDLDIIWQILKKDLPFIIQQLKKAS